MTPSLVPANKRIIMIPIDDSEEVDKSIHWTLEHLYRGGNDLLYFLHVVPEHTYNIIGGDAAETIITEDESAEKRAVDDAKVFIKHRVLEKIEAKEIPHQVEIVRFRNDTTSVGIVICERAATLDAAAVVMAKHHKGVIATFIVGSATSYVANNCKQPVVVLH